MNRKNTERDQAWMKARMALPRPKGSRGRPVGKHNGVKTHGTRYCYVDGCRCPECTDANRQYGIRHRKQKRGGREAHPGNCRMRWPKEPLERRRSLTVDSVEQMRDNVMPYYQPQRGLVTTNIPAAHQPYTLPSYDDYVSKGVNK